jgi:hypothetical protein
VTAAADAEDAEAEEAKLAPSADAADGRIWRAVASSPRRDEEDAAASIVSAFVCERLANATAASGRQQRSDEVRGRKGAHGTATQRARQLRGDGQRLNVPPPSSYASLVCMRCVLCCAALACSSLCVLCVRVVHGQDRTAATTNPQGTSNSESDGTNNME